MVLIPDYYRGKAVQGDIREFVREETDWQKLSNDWEETIRPYAQEKGCTKFGAIGTKSLVKET